MLETSHTWVGINTTNALFLLSRLTTFAETKKKLWYWKSVLLHDDIIQARTLQRRSYYFYFTNLGFESQPLNQYILPLWSREYSEIPGSSARGYSALSSPTARQSGPRSLQQGSALRSLGKPARRQTQRSASRLSGRTLASENKTRESSTASRAKKSVTQMSTSGRLITVPTRRANSLQMMYDGIAERVTWGVESVAGASCRPVFASVFGLDRRERETTPSWILSALWLKFSRLLENLQSQI